MNNKSIARYIFFIIIAICGLAAFYPAKHPEAALDQFNSGDLAWMLTASAMVLIMTPGLSFFYGGMVRPKNLISTLLQSFVALGIISLVWYGVGFSLAFGESLGGFLGNPFSFFMMDGVGTAADPLLSPTIPFILFAAFQLKFAIITPALITGSLAERVRFWGYLVFMVLFCLVVYCPLAHWTWHPEGFLRKWGVLDFAGGTVVHISAGVAALAGSIFLGSRNVGQKEIISPNIPYVLLGTGLLWFGWFGFNAGSALGSNTLAIDAFVTTNMASAAAMITWIIFEVIRGNKPTALGACVGAVVGLVAVTPAAGFIHYGPSLFIGCFAAIVSNYVVHWKNKSSDIDDTLDVFSCHGIGGITGMLLTPVFAKEVGLIYGETQTFLYHLLGLAIVLIYVFGVSYGLFWITNKITRLRVSKAHEEMGLDLSQHGETVYEEKLQAVD